MTDPRKEVAEHLIYVHKYPPDPNSKQVIEGLLAYANELEAKYTEAIEALNAADGAFRLLAEVAELHGGVVGKYKGDILANNAAVLAKAEGGQG